MAFPDQGDLGRERAEDLQEGSGQTGERTMAFPDQGDLGREGGEKRTKGERTL